MANILVLFLTFMGLLLIFSVVSRLLYFSGVPDYPKQAPNLNLITLNIKLLKENIRENLCYLGYMTPKA